MKKLIFLIMMLSLSATYCSAQTYTRSGNTFISSTGERIKSNAIKTKFTVKESDGKIYDIYCSSSTGACFINKISAKTGKTYRKYLGEDISIEVSKELNINYKPKKKEK